MTYTTLKNEDQTKNSPWIPRALTAVGLGALAFASGTHYRNSNNDVVVATTTLVRPIYIRVNDGLTKEETVCDCTKRLCQDEVDACEDDYFCPIECYEELCTPERDFVGPFGGECVALKNCVDKECD